ncbi:haloacid dehalogenase, partial [Paenibacillus riograndensis]
MAVLHVNDLAIPCKGILFDKDGTLLDLLATWGTWADLMLKGLENQLALIGKDNSGSGPGLARVLGTVHDDAGRGIGYDPAGPLSMATAEETNGILAWQLHTAGGPGNEAIARVTAIGKEALTELRRLRAAHPL